jgi:hypothetical protein
MASHEALISSKADDLVQRLLSESKLRGNANAFELCGLYSFEVVCKIGFAKDFNDSGNDDSKSLLRAMDGSAPLLLIVSGLSFHARRSSAKAT